MAKKDKSFDNLSVLNEIKTVLYVICVLLFAIMILNIVNVVNNKKVWSYARNTSASTDTNSESGESQEIPDYDVSAYTEIDNSGFDKVIKEKGTQVIYFGRATCGYCAMFIPIMNEAQELYGFKHNYYDVTRIWDYANNKMLDQDMYDKIVGYDSSDFMSNNFLSTPLIAVFKDGKYVDGTVGYQDLETYSKFLEGVGFKKK